MSFGLEQIEQFISRQPGAHVGAFQQAVGQVAFGAVHFDDLFLDHQTINRHRTRLTETGRPHSDDLMALMTGIKGLVICWWSARRVKILESVLSNTLRQRLLGVLALSVSGLFTAAAIALR